MSLRVLEGCIEYRGAKYLPGDIFEVEEKNEAERLIALGVAEKVTVKAEKVEVVGNTAGADKVLEKITEDLGGNEGQKTGKKGKK